MAEHQRVENGRFAPGNKGGPGRPKRYVEVEYMVSMLSACSLNDWEDIVRAAVEAAKGGDHKAREWLASYVIGQSGAKPVTFTALDEKATMGQMMDIF